MLTLGIETSCDETAASVVSNGKKILSNIISSSLSLHKQYGGVVPEIACRAHVELIHQVTDQALSRAHVRLKDIELIAVTQGPGLVGALLVGISMAKAISLALRVPLVGVNHLKAHLYASLMGKDRAKFPFVGLVVSGGHTALVYVKNWEKWELLGQTKDDAAGEAFDKVAKILNLGYPGGPIIDRLARAVGSKKTKFPRADLGNSLDFSFSGIKTAVLYYVKDHFEGSKAQSAERKAEKQELKDSDAIKEIAAGFQEAMVDMIVKNVASACKRKRSKRVVVGGGVSKNSELRKRLLEEGRRKQIEIYLPTSKLCLDNAAMVAGLGYQLYKRGVFSSLDLTAEPNLGI